MLIRFLARYFSSFWPECSIWFPFTVFYSLDHRSFSSGINLQFDRFPDERDLRCSSLLCHMNTQLGFQFSTPVELGPVNTPTAVQNWSWSYHPPPQKKKLPCVWLSPSVTPSIGLFHIFQIQTGLCINASISTARTAFYVIFSRLFITTSFFLAVIVLTT